MKIEDIKVGDKVVCIKEFHDDVTVGKEYRVLGIRSVCFTINDDVQDWHEVDTKNFKKVTKEQPTPKSLLKNGDVVLFEDSGYFRYLDLESEMSGFYSYDSHNTIKYYNENLEITSDCSLSYIVEIHRPSMSHHFKGECLSDSGVGSMNLIWSKESHNKKQERLEEIKTLEETISKAKEKLEELLKLV